MEQLTSLAYLDPTTDTTAFPPTSTGGSGLTVGGSSDHQLSGNNTPETGYVDSLDISGQPTTATGNWFYIRVWHISTFSTNLKQSHWSRAKVRRQIGAPAGALPQSTLTTHEIEPILRRPRVTL